MRRILLINQDRPLAQTVGLACLARGMAVGIAETLCEGIRSLLDGHVSVVLVDSALLRLPPADQARLFDAVAPGVPVAVLVSHTVSPPEGVRYQVLGLHVLSKSLSVEDLLEKVETLRLAASLRRDGAS